MTKAKLQHFFFLPVTARLRKIQEQARKDVLKFGKTLTGNPNLKDITAKRELEDLCDCLTLIRTGAVEIEYTDCISGKSDEGILLRLNTE